MRQMMRRIVFLPRATWAEFLNYLHIADGLAQFKPNLSLIPPAVLLDPHPFGGDTSSRESLFMETPVVTLPSEQLAGRYTQAFLHRVGLTECIAKDFDEYLAIAIRIASDKEYRKSLSEKLSKTKMNLFMQKVGIATHPIGSQPHSRTWLSRGRTSSCQRPRKRCRACVSRPQSANRMIWKI